MDTVLIAVTVISLGLAIVMGVLTARLLREDRARAEARVAVLSALAAEAAPPARPDINPPAPVPVPDLFSPHEVPSPWGRRIAIAGAVAAVVTAAVFLAMSDRSGAAPAPAPGPASLSREEAAAVSTTPLELLALQHTRDAQRLTISGLVRNPAGGARIGGIVATAYVFGPGGSFVTSGRAAVDVPALAPGGESPFVVVLPVAGAVSRYRVGFRGPDGAVLAHVDRRLPGSLASREEPR